MREGAAAMSKLRIFLADDHDVVCAGLKTLVDAQPDMEVIGQAHEGQSAWQSALDNRPDVMVMDVTMPGMNGAQATELIKRDCPEVKILALSVHEDTGYLRKLLEAGASGYVLKRSAAETLIHAIRIVAGDGVYLDPALAGKVVDSFVGKPSASSAPSTAVLSEREADVVRLIALGYSNKEIATQLNLSVKTIETYKVRAMEKLGLNSRVGLVRYAMHQGWLQEV
jgi:two-component system response regulator NreC